MCVELNEYLRFQLSALVTIWRSSC